MDKRVQIGVIGLGRVSQLHIQVLQALPSAEIVGVADADETKCFFIAEKLGVKAYPDWARLLEDERIRAVLVLTPPATHREIVEAAAACRKDVFCEKPIAHTLDDAIRIVKAARAAGVILQVGFVERFDIARCEAKRMIERNIIGQPLVLRTKRDVPRSVLELKGWLLDTRQGGGPILECGIHDIDQVMWLLGDQVEYVYCLGRTSQDGVLDNVSILMSLRSGAFANLAVSWTFPPTHQGQTELEIIGEKGYIQIRNPPRLWMEATSSDGLTGTFPCSHDIGERSCHLVDIDLPRFSPEIGSYFRQMRYFLTCVLNGRPPSPNGEDGVKALEIAAAATESLTSRKPIRFT